MYPRFYIRFAPILLLSLFTLQACANLGAVKPETFNQYALLATNAATAALDTIDSLNLAGKLTNDETRAKVAEVDEFKQSIDAARVLYRSDPGQAFTDLERVSAGLNALSALLQTKKGSG
jgi:hypothetical protein